MIGIGGVCDFIPILTVSREAKYEEYKKMDGMAHGDQVSVLNLPENREKGN
ncbi:MAG: hypothetical protein RLP12_01575 [Ekhidna sp.]